MKLTLLLLRSEESAIGYCTKPVQSSQHSHHIQYL
jgi:hypothetical protein